MPDFLLTHLETGLCINILSEVPVQKVRFEILYLSHQLEYQKRFSSTGGVELYSEENQIDLKERNKDQKINSIKRYSLKNTNRE